MPHCRLLGERLSTTQPDAWRWRGREVKLIDGTTVSMPDTAANQVEFLQSKKPESWLGLSAGSPGGDHFLVLWRDASFKATLQLVRAFEENLRHAPRERLVLRRAYLLAGVSRLRLPDRPGRVEPRAVKRRAKPQSLLTQPRHILKTALMKQQQMLHDERLR